MAKIDELIGYVIEIKDDISDVKVDVAGVKQHLKDLNGKVVKQEKAQQENITDHGEIRKEISNIKVTLAKIGGGIFVGLFLLEIGFNVLF